MANNNFLTFASGSGAVVQSDAAYATDAARQSGFQNGIADPAHVNKVWRQGAFGSAALGQILSTYGLVDANDDGDVPGFVGKLRSSLAAMLSGVLFGQDTSTTANAIVVALDPAPPSLVSYRELFVRVANTNTGPITIALNALGSKPATRRDGTPFQSGDVMGGQIAHFLFDQITGQWVLEGAANGEVPKISSNPTLWARTDATGSAPDGSANTAAAAFPTIRAAIDYAQARLYLGSGTLTVRLGNPGTYAPPGNIAAGTGAITIQGDPNFPAGYLISGSSVVTGACLIAAIGCTVTLNGVNIQNTGSTLHNVGAVGAGSLYVVNSTLSGTQTSGMSQTFAAQGGTVTLFAGVTYSGNFGSAMSASGGAILIAGTQTVIGTPTYTGAFAVSTEAGTIKHTGFGFTGGAVGQRYSVTLNGIINTFGSGANYFPGSSAGLTSTGGQYA